MDRQITSKNVSKKLFKQKAQIASATRVEFRIVLFDFPQGICA